MRELHLCLSTVLAALPTSAVRSATQVGVLHGAGDVRYPAMENLVKYDSSRDGAWKNFAWTCRTGHKLPEPPLPMQHGAFPYGRYRRIFYQHPRKAAGTTLAFWLACVAQYHNMTFVTHEDFTFDPNRLDAEPDTFFVTSLRDPISRITSSYKYEGRWHTLSENRTTATAFPFMDWVEAGIGTRTPCKACSGMDISACRVCVTHGGPHWGDTSSEYYVKTFGGSVGGGADVRDFTMSGDNEKLAERVLMRFHSVVQVEKLTLSSYETQLQKDFNIRLPITRFSAWGASKRVPEEPYSISAFEMQRLHDLNQRDIRLVSRVTQRLEQ